jgi:hypothetical protein
VLFWYGVIIIIIISSSSSSSSSGSGGGGGSNFRNDSRNNDPFASALLCSASESHLVTSASHSLCAIVVHLTLLLGISPHVQAALNTNDTPTVLDCRSERSFTQQAGVPDWRAALKFIGMTYL